MGDKLSTYSLDFLFQVDEVSVNLPEASRFDDISVVLQHIAEYLVHRVAPG